VPQRERNCDANKHEAYGGCNMRVDKPARAQLRVVCRGLVCRRRLSVVRFRSTSGEGRPTALSVVRFHFFPAKAAPSYVLLSLCTRTKPQFRCTPARTPRKSPRCENECWRGLQRVFRFRPSRTTAKPIQFLRTQAFLFGTDSWTLVRFRSY
jgi:hypothetical protein